MEMTVAGTAQDFHLIPFYALVEHQHITKSGAKVRIINDSTKKVPVFYTAKCKLFRNIGFAELTFRPEIRRKKRFSFNFSHLFRNFALKLLMANP
jgi:hypothetical protein